MKFSNFIGCEVDKCLASCNFTKDEEQVFARVTKGKSIIEIADEMNLSSRTIDRKIKSIKTKIERAGVFNE